MPKQGRSPAGGRLLVVFAAVAASAARDETGRVQGGVDASDSFASNLVAYEPTVDAGVFRLPVPVEPLPASTHR